LVKLFKKTAEIPLLHVKLIDMKSRLSWCNFRHLLLNIHLIVWCL